MLLYYEILYTFLFSLGLIFVLVISAYYLVKIDKKNKILNANFIVGTWTRKGRSPEGEPWSLKYIISPTTIEMRAEPSFRTKGTYKIIKEIENLMRLDVSNVTGDENVPRKLIQLAVDKKADRLNIDGRDFLRLKS